jgi:ferritin-like metal-binding protein YciE
MSTNDKILKERNETLQKYVSDMMAVEDHISAAVQRQVEHEDVYKHHPQASQIIQSIAQMTEQHAKHLEQHLESIGGDKAKGIKEVATAALGAVAGMYDKIRTESVSKMLRDDYTALNLAAVSYTMLHTTGLALHDQRTADLALQHLKHYTGIIMQINQIIPNVVVNDLRNDVPSVNESSIQQAMQNTQDAWKPSTDGGSYQNLSGGGNRPL